MSSSSSSVAKVTTRSRRIGRSPSASEIARNIQHFETWSTHQRCEQVSYSDLPEEVKADVTEVFDVNSRLPAAWADKNSKQFRSLSLCATPAFLRFIHDAHKDCPSLFSDTVAPLVAAELFAEITIVFSAWRRLQRMRACMEKWSEADFVANVYNVFRSSALHESAHRVHCKISLPQPSLRTNLSTQATRILKAKTVIPDCAVFIPARSLRSLAHSSKSPFKVIKSQASVTMMGSPSKGSSFRFQSTPCAQLPDAPGFEFVSSFWEDKKPIHQMLEDAYRQNRMATASAVRHLNSLRIEAPVFGLIWSNGTVRAHIDWCKNEKGKDPTVFSAPYPGKTGIELQGLFHEWGLDRPGDILQVYFLIKNIDRWTVGKFKERVVNGVNNLLDDVVRERHQYRPWKRVGDLTPASLSKRQKENTNISMTTASSLSPPKTKGKGRRR